MAVLEVIAGRPGTRGLSRVPVSPGLRGLTGRSVKGKAREETPRPGPANTPAGALITLSTLLLSGLLFQQHYSLPCPCIPGNYTAELVLPEEGGETVAAQTSAQCVHQPN